MNYLTDPCGDRVISSVLTPVHLKDPLPDALLYPTGIVSQSKESYMYINDHRKGERSSAVNT
jgi:hypothetical protein